MEKMAYTVAEAAKAIGISTHTMYNLCHSEGFPALNFGRTIRIPKKPFEEWIYDQARKK